MTDGRVDFEVEEEDFDELRRESIEDAASLRFLDAVDFEGLERFGEVKDESS